MSAIEKIMPTRAQNKPHKVIADIDDLASPEHTFRCNGKLFSLKRATVAQYMASQLELDKLQNLFTQQQNGHDVTLGELYDAYLSYFQSLCPQFTMQDLKSLEAPQVRALVNLFVRHMTSQTLDEVPNPTSELEDEKKKGI